MPGPVIYPGFLILVKNRKSRVLLRAGRKEVYPPLLSKTPVERAVLYGFGYVVGEDVFRTVEVGHSAGDLEYPVVRAGAEAEPVYRGLK